MVASLELLHAFWHINMVYIRGLSRKISFSTIQAALCRWKATEWDQAQWYRHLSGATKKLIFSKNIDKVYIFFVNHCQLARRESKSAWHIKLSGSTALGFVHEAKRFIYFTMTRPNSTQWRDDASHDLRIETVLCAHSSIPSANQFIIWSTAFVRSPMIVEYHLIPLSSCMLYLQYSMLTLQLNHIPERIFETTLKPWFIGFHWYIVGVVSEKKTQCRH